MDTGRQAYTMKDLVEQAAGRGVEDALDGKAEYKQAYGCAKSPACLICSTYHTLYQRTRKHYRKGKS